MKALVLKAYSELEYEEVPIPEVADDGILLKVEACGICGSDIHGFDGSSGRRIPPVIMGHEASGVVDRVGSEVEDWRTGDRVTFDSTVHCGRCNFCLSGYVNLCDSRRVVGVSCADYREHGAFAEYLAIPARVLYRLPDQISFEHAAMVEPVSIALHGSKRLELNPGSVGVVVGVGMIGLLVVQVLRYEGCETIFAVDIDPAKLDLACELGADRGIRSDVGDAVDEVLELTGGRGADISVEAVGLSPTVKIAIHSVRKGGAVSLIGNISAETDFPLQAVVTRQLSLFGSCGSAGEYPEALRLIESEKIKVEPLISQVASLEEGGEWFRRLYGGERDLMKVILKPRLDA